MATHFVIVGNGAAGLSAAEEIRRRDAQARIYILSDEPHLFYSRPGLAYYLSGDIPHKRVIARTQEYYRDLRLELVHSRCEQLQTDEHMVGLADGRRLRYDAALLAVGNRAVPAPFPGADLDGVVYLDMLNQARDIVQRTRKSRQAIVVGGGVTALELVEGFHARGVHTHYLLRRDRYWSALLSEKESRLIESRLEEEGVVLHRNTEVVALEGRRGRVYRAQLGTGDTLPCDLVGVAIGVRPNLTLAQQAGLRTERGILVDEYLRTSATDVYAAGDVAQIRDRWSGEYRLDSLWPSAIASGRAAGANMAGAGESYEKGVPFNVAKLCGVMLTAIGQAAAQRTADEAQLEISRGSSQVWTATPVANYSRMGRATGSDSIRLVIRDNVLAGALVLGDQSLVTPLLQLIGAEVDVSPILPQLHDRARSFGEVIQPFWQAWKASRNGHGRPQD
ncbi:MAG: NAD(P)/FAD-dependent oxidoreductase [Anaerolineae bacterium]